MGDLVERRGLGAAVAPERRRRASPLACAPAARRPRARRRDERPGARGRRGVALGAGGGAAACVLRRGGCSGPAPRAAGRLARATFGQYPDVLADLHDRGGLPEVARGIPRHVAASCATGCRAARGHARLVGRPATRGRPAASCRAKAGWRRCPAWVGRDPRREVRKPPCDSSKSSRRGRTGWLDRRSLVNGRVHGYRGGLHGLGIGAWWHNDCKVEELNVDR